MRNGPSLGGQNAGAATFSRFVSTIPRKRGIRLWTTLQVPMSGPDVEHAGGYEDPLQPLSVTLGSEIDGSSVSLSCLFRKLSLPIGCLYLSGFGLKLGPPLLVPIRRFFSFSVISLAKCEPDKCEPDKSEHQ